MGRILAFDTGQKRTGIAVTDSEQRIAKPLETIPTAKTEMWLKLYFSKEIVDAFVVGIPHRLNGEKTHGTQIAEQFGKALHEIYPEIPIYWIDERLTSVQAAASLIENGIPRKKRKDKNLLDATAAALILQSFLNQRLFHSKSEGQ